MQKQQPDSISAATNPELPAPAFLRLLVRNHAGVMSHVSGLFARRACNVDGILCLPIGDGTRSAILLAIADDGRVEQMIRHLTKLEDVVEVARASGGEAAFAGVRTWLRPFFAEEVGT
jgi:acetolactate synthase-1/3 small subunit